MATFEERFDQHKLSYIIQNKNEYKKVFEGDGDSNRDPTMSPACTDFLQNRGVLDGNGQFDYFAMAQKYLKFSQNGRYTTVYDFSKNSNTGRLFAEGGISLQCMPRLIRNTISAQFYQDIDMVNAHPTIILGLCRKHKIQCKKLQKYVTDRDNQLKKVMDSNNITRDEAKQVFLSILNNGESAYNKLKVKSKFLTNYKNEMKRTMESFKDLYPQIYKDRVRARPSNPLGSTINYITCQYENEILLFLVEEFKKDGLIDNNAVLCYDGLMIPKSKEKVNLQKYEELIKLRFNIDIKLKSKPMDEQLEIPRDIPKYVRNMNDHIIPDKKLPFLQLRKKVKAIGFQFNHSSTNIPSESNVDTFMEDLKRRTLTRLKFVAKLYSQYIIFQRTEGKLFAWMAEVLTTNDKSQAARSAYKWSSHEVNNAFHKAWDITFHSKKNKISFSLLDYLIDDCPLTVNIDTTQNFPGFPLIIQKTISDDPLVILNSWKGRAMKAEDIVKEIEGSLTKKQIKKFKKRIHKHMYDVLAAGNKKEGEYIENFIACCINDPTFFPGVSASFTSLPGVGKSKFMDYIFSQYFGSAYGRSSGFDPSALGNDNIFLGTDIVVVDEIQISNKDAFDRLKNLITEDTIKVRQMYRNAQTGIRNNTKFIFNSNHVDPFPFEGPNQRRFAKFRCSDSFIGNDKYFEKLYDDVPQLFFPYYFISLWTDEFANDMKSYKFRNPKTMENEKSKAGHLSVCTKFAVSLAKDTLQEKATMEMPLDDLYDLFVIFCETNRIRHILSKHNFARNEDLKALLSNSNERKRVDGRVTSIRVLNSIKTLRDNLETRFKLDLDDVYV